MVGNATSRGLKLCEGGVPRLAGIRPPAALVADHLGTCQISKVEMKTNLRRTDFGERKLAPLVDM
jgi:hypothetical protein